MIKIYILSLLTISIILGQKQTQDISGVVIDIDNLEPLPYANVVVQDMNRGITTNSDGQFVLVDVPAVPCTLIISYIGSRMPSSA